MHWTLPFPPSTIQRLQHVQALIDSLEPEARAEALAITRTPSPQEHIIVLTASFNPPTNAHLALLQEAQRYAQDHPDMYVYAAMSKRTVDKEGVERPLLVERLLLLDQVLHQHLPQTGILLFNRGLYVEQAAAIRNSFPQVKRILFLLGFDKILQIFDPRYYDDRDKELTSLFNMVELLVSPRGNAGAHELEVLLQQPQNQPFRDSISLLPLRQEYRYISSTNVRQETRQHTHEVPQEVLQFMEETHAYMPAIKESDGMERDYYGDRMKYIYKLLGKQ